MPYNALLLCRELVQKAEEKTGGRPDGELQEKFSQLPNEEEELQEEMLKLRAEADGIACNNPGVVSIITALISWNLQIHLALLLCDAATSMGLVSLLHVHFIPAFLTTQRCWPIMTTTKKFNDHCDAWRPELL